MSHTILIVDDSPTHRSLLKVFLSGHGFTFCEAEGGAQGLEIIEATPIDLVIADYNMPGMDGIALVRRIRALPALEHRSLPVILLTAEKEKSIMTEARAAGADEFLRKPVSSAGVLEVVQRLLERPK